MTKCWYSNDYLHFVKCHVPFTNVFNKLACYFPGRPFQPIIMCGSKAGAYPRGGPFSWATLVNAPDLTEKH